MAARIGALHVALALAALVPIRASVAGIAGPEPSQAPPAATRPPVAAPADLLAAAESLRSRGTADAIRQSMPQFEDALAAARRAGDRRTEAAAVTALGRAEDSVGDKRKAIARFSEALDLHRANGDAESEANTLNFKGLAHDALGELAEARRLFDAALAAGRAIGDRRIEAVALNNIALVNLHTGDRRAAIDVYIQALAIHRAIDNIRGQAVTLTGIGATYDVLGEKQKALDALTEALPLQRRLADIKGEATTLVNIGAVHYSLDDLPKALEYYNQALPLLRQAGDRVGESATLHNIGSVDQQRAQYQTAIERYQEALTLQRAAGYRAGEANTLTNLARVYDQLGNPEQALEVYEQALALHRVTGNRASEGTALNNMASASLRHGDLDRAVERAAQALAIMRDTANRSGEATVLVNQGRIASRRRDYTGAAASYRRALELYRATASRRGEALALGNLAGIEALLGDDTAAAADFERALAINTEIGQTSGQAAILLLLARFEAARGRVQAAQDHLATALALVEGVRANVTNDDLRMTYFASVQEYYELAVDLSMARHAAEPSAGWAARALEAAERGRARALIDMLTESRIDIREGVDGALLERQRDLERLLRTQAERQTRLLSGTHTESQATSTAADVRRVTADLEDANAQIRRRSPRYALLTQPAPISADEIQRDLLDADTVLLEFAVGATRSFAFAVTPSSIDAYELPGRARIDDAAREYYRLAQAPETSAKAQEAARQLSAIILQPVAHSLIGGRRLAIVATGTLQSIPFAALPSPSAPARPLLADHEIVMLPSASVAALLRREAAARSSAARGVLVFADPVFRADDPRVAPVTPAPSGPPRPVTRAFADLIDSNDTANLPRLVGSRREAAAIAAILPQGGVTQVLGFDATRAAATGDDPSRFRVVHFATHAFVSGAQPALSGIVLSLVDRSGAPQDGFVRMRDIFNLRLNADLVVLSACQTALGKDVRGEGLIGLGRGFIHAGALRVVATTWKVDDAATAELMTRFYQGMLGPERLTAAAALRAAQLSVSRQRRFQSPYYWSPFVLQGEWR